MRQKIRLAVGFMHQDLKLLLIDEPTTNLDILTREVFLNFLEQNVRNTGLTVFYSSHIFPEIKRIADFLLILHKGSIVGHYDFYKKNQKPRNYLLCVDNKQLAIRVLEANNFSISLIDNESLLLKLQPQQSSNELIDLLREHEIQIHSFTEDAYMEAFSQLIKIQQNTSEKLILEN
jgi:ABC-2 type transport system ATP-binding protein